MATSYQTVSAWRHTPTTTWRTAQDRQARPNESAPRGQPRDWTFGNGRGNYAAASDSVAQRVKTRLRSFRGNWFLDLDHGLPWLDLMERPADLVHLEREVKRCILTTEGVRRLTAFSMALDADTAPSPSTSPCWMRTNTPPPLAPRCKGERCAASDTLKLSSDLRMTLFIPLFIKCLNHGKSYHHRIRSRTAGHDHCPLARRLSLHLRQRYQR
ncbi:hypothetical protein MRX62_13515 (plasmid) [Xylella fastidiosa subsp. pauca]